MITLINYLTCFSILFELVVLQEDENSTVAINKKCRERNRLIATEKGDLYTLIDATLEQKVILQCHYCNENDDARPKNWFKTDKLGVSKPKAVTLSMDNDNNKNRIHVNTEHSLTIHNFTENDTGLYYCVGFEDHDNKEKQNYLVDFYEDNVTTIETGNITSWNKYHEEYFVPINQLFRESDGTEFVKIRNDLKLKMELITGWDPWGICEVCGRPKGEGIRKKKGLCRIKISPQGSNITSKNENETYFLSATAISCNSKRLYDSFPGICNLTRVIPHFMQSEPCEGICNPDAEGVNKGWKVGKSKGYKYRKTFVLAEDSHLTLVCPESTLENVVIWRRKSKTLKPGQGVIPENPKEEPRIIVDTFNTLYLVKVRDSEAGNYTCQVDDIKMQQVIVFIVSKSRLLTQAFIRHMMYLGFVLSLTLTCYCAGLFITCARRHTFKSYDQILQEQKKKHKGEFKNLI